MTDTHSHPPGPRRGPGAPVGPEEVRRAVLDAAARLFAERGVDAVSLRDIAGRADVHVALIPRYLGSRDDLVTAVFDDLCERVAQAVVDRPLAGQGFGTDTAMGQWVRVAAALALAGQSLHNRVGFNPVTAMAETLADGYGLDETSARVRAAQVVAAALGWRIFEDYLLEAGDLHDVPLPELRDDLAHSLRRLGATPWPSPPDPPTVHGEPDAWTCRHRWCRSALRPGTFDTVWHLPQGGAMTCVQTYTLGTFHPFARAPWSPRAKDRHMTEKIANQRPAGLERGVLHQLPAGVGQQRRPGARLDPGGVQEDRRQVRVPALAPREQLVPALHPQHGQPDPLRRAVPARSTSTPTSAAPAPRRDPRARTRAAACWSAPATTSTG